MKEPITVKEIREGWHAPGYRDPELHFVTDAGEFHFRLTPQAFVELHNALCMQQGCIDDNCHAALDIDVYPFHTTHVSTLRTSRPLRELEERATRTWAAIERQKGGAS